MKPLESALMDLADALSKVDEVYHLSHGAIDGAVYATDDAEYRLFRGDALNPTRWIVEKTYKPITKPLVRPPKAMR